MKIDIRKATEKDCNFLAKIILRAESTGFEMTSYSWAFEKSNSELEPLIAKVINNPSKGHPLCFDSYFIATVDEVPAAAISVYIEGDHGDSNHLMTGALMSVFSREELQKAFRKYALHKDIEIRKSVGTLQIDCVATLAEFTGNKLFSKLLIFAEKLFKNQGVKASEIHVWRNNKRAVDLYKYNNYDIFEQKLSAVDPSNGKVLMTKCL